MSVDVTLLITYRNREEHLKAFFEYLVDKEFSSKIEIVIVEGNQFSTLEHYDWPIDGVKYYFLPMDGAFHKTKLLNYGLSHAEGEFLIPYDIDLIPMYNSICDSIEIARASPNILVSGYRLMSDQRSINFDVNDLEIGLEDYPEALKKHLLNKEKFGVCTVLNTERLRGINGWDEGFVGWGAEDQDMIERYCSDDVFLGKFPSIVYAHLDHGKETSWNEEKFVKRNRQLYYDKRK